MNKLPRKSVAYVANLIVDKLKGKHECPLKFTLKSYDQCTKLEHGDLYATFLMDAFTFMEIEL